MNRRITLDSAIALGFSFFLLGLSGFYVMFLGPGHGDFTVCGPGVRTSCWENALGPIFMFLSLFGGVALFCIGAFYRKTARITLWESVLLGYIVSLFFDLVVLPTSAFLLPLNGGGILIFSFLLMSLVGIVFSALKYVQTSNGDTPQESHIKLSLLASPRRKKIYALTVIAGLMLATSLYLAPSIVYGGLHSCYVAPGNLSYQISNYNELVGPPLFSQNYEQFLLTPGQTAFVTYVWNATTYGNNLTDFFTRGPRPGGFNYTSMERVNGFTGWGEYLTPNQTGVSIIFLNLTFQGTHIAKFFYKISVNNSAPSGTYYLYGGLGCALGLLLTVGFLPYWGPLIYGEIQPMAYLSNVAISLIGSSLLITALHLHYSENKKNKEHPLSTITN